MDGLSMDVTLLGPEAPDGEGKRDAYSCLQASREAPDRLAVYLQQQQVQVVVQGGNRSAGVGGPVLRVPHMLAAWALRLGSTGSLSQPWSLLTVDTSLSPHPGQLSAENWRQQLS